MIEICQVDTWDELYLRPEKKHLPSRGNRFGTTGSYPWHGRDGQCTARANRVQAHNLDAMLRIAAGFLSHALSDSEYE